MKNKLIIALFVFVASNASSQTRVPIEKDTLIQKCYEWNRDNINWGTEKHGTEIETVLRLPDSVYHIYTMNISAHIRYIISDSSYNYIVTVESNYSPTNGNDDNEWRTHLNESKKALDKLNVEYAKTEVNKKMMELSYFLEEYPKVKQKRIEEIASNEKRLKYRDSVAKECEVIRLKEEKENDSLNKIEYTRIENIRLTNLYFEKQTYHKEYRRNFGYKGAPVMSLILPGTGDILVDGKYKPMHAVTTVSYLVFAAGAVYSYTEMNNSYSLYHNATSQKDMNTYYNQSVNWQTTMISCAVTAGSILLIDFIRVEVKNHMNKKKGMEHHYTFEN